MRTVEVRFRDATAHQTYMCRRTRDGVTPEEDPASLKKVKLESAHQEGPDVGPSVCQSRGTKLDTVDLAPGAIEGGF